MPSVAEDLGGGGGEVVEIDRQIGVVCEMLSGGVGDIFQAEQSQITCSPIRIVFI